MQGNVKETWEEELRCLLIISCEQVSHEMAHVPLSVFSNFPIRAILTVSNFKSSMRFFGKSYNDKKTCLKSLCIEVSDRRGKCLKSFDGDLVW